MEIKVRNLHKSFGANHVLRGVDLDLPEGKISVILGGSGSGKTVLLKHIIGLIRPDSGSVIIDGKDIAKMREREMLPIRMRIGYIFQGGSLLNSLNVFDNIALGLREHHLASEKKIRQIVQEKLELMGLGDRMFEMPANLSGGMRKRVAIARELTMDPEAFLYDEPTSDLDPPRADQVDSMIREMSRNYGATTVLVTHDLISAFSLADRIFFLHEGRIIESGTPDEFRRSTSEITQSFIARQSFAGSDRTTDRR